MKNAVTKLVGVLLLLSVVLSMTACDDAKGFEKEARIVAYSLFDTLDHTTVKGPERGALYISGEYLCVPSEIYFKLNWSKKKYRGEYELTLHNDLDPTIFTYVGEVEKPGKDDNYVDFYMSDTYYKKISSYSKYKINYAYDVMSIDYNLWIGCEVSSFGYVMDNEYTEKIACGFNVSSTFEEFVYGHFPKVSSLYGGTKYIFSFDSFYDKLEDKTKYSSEYHTDNLTLYTHEATVDFENGTLTYDPLLIEGLDEEITLKLYEPNVLSSETIKKFELLKNDSTLRDVYENLIPRMDEYHTYVGKSGYLSPYSKGMSYSDWIVAEN